MGRAQRTSLSLSVSLSLSLISTPPLDLDWIRMRMDVKLMTCTKDTSYLQPSLSNTRTLYLSRLFLFNALARKSSKDITLQLQSWKTKKIENLENYLKSHFQAGSSFGTYVAIYLFRKIPVQFISD